MAKGRRLISSRSERLLGMGTYHYGHVSHHGEVSDMAELGEDDVWSMVEDTSDHHQQQHGGEWTPHAATESRRRRVGVTCQDGNRHLGGLSLAFEDKTTSSRRIVHQLGGTRGGAAGPHGGRHVATSAPVNVPDWSKILRVNSVESMHDSDEDDLVGDSGMEPPHEYLARSRKMNAFSVYEGVGRTLKGRDMSRVRDEVWSQTGFEG